jgi:hypothetical protein
MIHNRLNAPVDNYTCKKEPHSYAIEWYNKKPFLRTVFLPPLAMAFLDHY